MLSDEEKARLSGEVVATAEVMGQAISLNAARMMVSDLSRYRLDQILPALEACRAEVRSKLTLAEVVMRIADGRPGREEAWGIALQSTDEAATVVWNSEISLALTAAQPLLVAGDRIAARMAFLQAYERIVLENRRSGAAPSWSLSIGTDVAARAPALERAVQLNRITSNEAERFARMALPAPLTADGQAIAGLLGHDSAVVGPPSEEMRQRLKALRESIKAGSGDTHYDRTKSYLDTVKGAKGYAVDLERIARDAARADQGDAQLENDPQAR